MRDAQVNDDAWRPRGRHLVAAAVRQHVLPAATFPDRCVPIEPDAGPPATGADLHVPAADAILVGDSAIDLQTARNAGAQVLLVSYGFGFRFAADELTAVRVASTPSAIAQELSRI